MIADHRVGYAGPARASVSTNVMSSSLKHCDTDSALAAGPGFQVVRVYWQGSFPELNEPARPTVRHGVRRSPSPGAIHIMSPSVTMILGPGFEPTGFCVSCSPYYHTHKKPARITRLLDSCVGPTSLSKFTNPRSNFGENWQTMAG